jgi:hypothetical protein
MAVNLSRSKYGNRKAEEDGYTFDSEMELRRYRELKTLRDNGVICHLDVHPVYPLIVNGHKITRYTADFTYYDRERNEFVTEDVKGARTRDYILRKKLMKALHGIDVKEVKA